MEALEKAVRDSGVSFEDFKQKIKEDLISQEVERDEVGAEPAADGQGRTGLLRRAQAGVCPAGTVTAERDPDSYAGGRDRRASGAGQG